MPAALRTSRESVHVFVISRMLCEYLPRCAHQPPRMLAETLLDLAERECDPRRQDDKTVFCARIAQRRAARRAAERLL